MSPAPRNQKKRKGGKRGKVASSDLAVSAGRGPSVPRANLGKDTLLGLAQSQRRTLAFCGVSGLTTGVGGAIFESTYILNGAFNPIAGVSPVGYAKYMAFYSKAFVLGARIRVRGVGRAVTTAGAYAVGVVVTTNSTAIATTQAGIENGMIDYRLMLTNPDHFELSQSVEVSRFLNKPRVLDDPQLFSTASANPTQLIVAHLFTQTVGTPSSIEVDSLVEIEFDVVFTDPIPFT